MKMKWWAGLTSAALTAVTMVTGVAPSATAAANGPVGSTPASYTPSLATSGTDGSVEQVRQIVQCGDTMYAVGQFSAMTQGGVTYRRKNAISFSATTGAVTSWNPRPNRQVDSIALSADCTRAYLGGQFKKVGGHTRWHLASVDTKTGALRTRFRPAPNQPVTTVAVLGSHILVGGSFTALRSSTKHPYLASVRRSNGTDDGYSNLRISGKYVFTNQNGRHSRSNFTRVYKITLNPARTRMLAMGVFTSVSGYPRRQIFMANLGTSVSMTRWRSTEFNTNCHVTQPFWLKAASWSPDGRTVYTASTGYKPSHGSAFSTSAHRRQLCDSAAAFPSTRHAVTHKWINWTGCDSLFATAADSSAAYFGGHERWASNGTQCDNNNNGTAVTAPGMVGLSPSTGAVVANPTRDRGRGADDMLVTSAGLWIASDNAYNANACGTTATGARATGHAGICFLPYDGLS